MRILVIDDDVTIAELIRAVVEDAGYECATCHSARELPSGPFDVVVTDLLETVAYSRAAAARWLERLVERYPGTPIIVVTAHAETAGDRDRLPARRVIMKPFEIEQLLEAIRQLPAR